MSEIKTLQKKLTSLDEEIAENGRENSSHALKEYQRILNEIESINEEEQNDKLIERMRKASE